MALDAGELVGDLLVREHSIELGRIKEGFEPVVAVDRGGAHRVVEVFEGDVEGVGELGDLFDAGAGVRAEPHQRVDVGFGFVDRVDQPHPIARVESAEQVTHLWWWIEACRHVHADAGRHRG